MAIEERIDEFFHGRQFMLVAWLAMAVSAVVAAHSGTLVVVDHGHGIFFDYSHFLSGYPVLSTLANVLVVTVIGVLLQLLNKVYGFVRSSTSLLASTFYLLTMANPYTAHTLYAGTALALVLVLGTFYLYVSYLNPKAQHSIFLTFVVITTSAMFHWLFVLLLVIFMIGFMEMRVMQWRGIVAMLLGIITPFWIVLGLGIVAPTQFMPIHLSAVWSLPQLPQWGVFIVSVVVTALAGIVLACVNLYTIIGYRLQWRLYNAFVIVVGLITIVAMCVFFHDIQVLLPMLNVFLAVEVAHAFTIAKWQRRYIMGFVLVAWSVLSCVGILFV